MPADETPRLKTFAEMGSPNRLTVCPACHRTGFYVSTNWVTIRGEHRRLRKCRWCGHVRSETVHVVPDD